MGVLVASEYPVLIELIHNDVPIGTYTDEWGTVNVYLISSIHYLNRTTQTWTVTAADTKGKTYTATVLPQVDGTLNLPTPRRFESMPMTFGLTFVRSE